MDLLLLMRSVLHMTMYSVWHNWSHRECVRSLGAAKQRLAAASLPEHSCVPTHLAFHSQAANRDDQLCTPDPHCA